MQTNLPTLSTSTLPAHLAALVGKNLTVSASALVGLSTGGALRLVANQGRFRVKDGSTETVLDLLHLDTIIVGALSGYTKNYYAKAYTPGADTGEQPDCASLLGDVPDANSPSKQAASCSVCPQNVWGSKISGVGSEVKACSDYRRIALCASDDPEVVYQVNVPPASIKNWAKYVKELSMRGVDVSMVITRISLQEHMWVFNFAGFITAEQYEAVSGLIGSPQVADVLGLTGIPAAAPVAVAAPAPVAVAAPAPVVAAVAAPAPVEVAAPAAAAPKKGRGFGKGASAAAATPAATATATPAAASVTVSTGLEGLAAELGSLIAGAPDA